MNYIEANERFAEQLKNIISENILSIKFDIDYPVNNWPESYTLYIERKGNGCLGIKKYCSNLIALAYKDVIYAPKETYHLLSLDKENYNNFITIVEDILNQSINNITHGLISYYDTSHTPKC